MKSSQPLPHREAADNAGPVAPELKSALDALETALATPMVPGEHEAWTKAISEAWKASEAVIRQHLGRHEQQYEEMLAADPEIFRRVDLLREEGRAIADEVRAVGENIDKLRLKTPVAEPNEASTDKEREAAVDGGISLLVRIRKQEVAIGTWYSEAFNRDRGAVD